MLNPACRGLLKPTSWFVMLAVVAALVWPIRASATEPLGSWRPEVMATVGITDPLGSLLNHEIGTRYPIGLEARARSESGIGGAVAAQVWWARTEGKLSGVLPVTVEFSYAYPVLGGMLVPFGGISGRYSYSSLRLGPSEEPVVAAGSGFGAGVVLGTEAPLGSRFKGLCRVQVILGQAWLSFSDDFGEFVAGEHSVGLSSLEFTLGISTDMLDACIW